MGILGNITGGLIKSTIGKTAGGQSLARLLGAGLPAGGEVGNTIRSSARWTRSGPTDYRVKCVLPPNSAVWGTFFGGSAQSSTVFATPACAWYPHRPLHTGHWTPTAS